jgi:hypothetical protein
MEVPAVADIKIHPDVWKEHMAKCKVLLDKSTYGELTLRQQNYLYYFLLTGKRTEACRRAGYSPKDCKHRAYIFKHSIKMNKAHKAYLSYILGSLDPADYP